MTPSRFLRGLLSPWMRVSCGTTQRIRWKAGESARTSPFASVWVETCPSTGSECGLVYRPGSTCSMKKREVSSKEHPASVGTVVVALGGIALGLWAVSSAVGPE